MVHTSYLGGGSDSAHQGLLVLEPGCHVIGGMKIVLSNAMLVIEKNFPNNIKGLCTSHSKFATWSCQLTNGKTEK